MAKAKRLPIIQEINTIEDLGSLVVGDVVRVKAEIEGRLVSMLMAVVNDPLKGPLVEDAIDLAYRISDGAIYYVGLHHSRIRVADNELHFDYSLGSNIEKVMFSRQNYTGLENDINQAGL